MYLDRLDFTIKLARRVGFYLLQHWGNALNVREKSSFQDIVSDCDKQAQHMIVSEIERHFPHEAILAEEDRFETGQKLWIVDPIDGTMNFVHGLPSFAVGIAYSESGDVLIGVVHDPVLNETFYAVKGEGAYRNGERISVSTNATLRESIGNVGFYVGFTGHFMNAVEKRVRRMRMTGSAVLAASYVACGRFDFFVARRANPWDVAPVLLIVPEAGGCVTDLDGKQASLSSGAYLFSNGKLHSEVLEIVNKVKGSER
ncbi:inositol monophosphatase family protein [Thermotoga sp. Ku-13t]|uniref:inositol monophosphatase family protein n=1 Tax=Thermotoga sp. Ku-13t TaxID=1755813 RepID=UPI002407DBEA|nr:inositol monophosphatase family protein [Thermotoga sp. Ku-13t]